MILFACLFFFVSCIILQLGDVPPQKDPVVTLQYLLGSLPKLIVSGHLLGVQLMSVNAYLHTSIMYGQWEGWDGIPLDQPPLFYNGLTESAANLLSSMCDEIVNTAKKIEQKSGVDMSKVWLCYANYNSSVATLLTYNLIGSIPKPKKPVF